MCRSCDVTIDENRPTVPDSRICSRLSSLHGGDVRGPGLEQIVLVDMPLGTTPRDSIYYNDSQSSKNTESIVLVTLHAKCFVDAYSSSMLTPFDCPVPQAHSIHAIADAHSSSVDSILYRWSPLVPNIYHFLNHSAPSSICRQGCSNPEAVRP